MVRKVNTKEKESLLTDEEGEINGNLKMGEIIVLLNGRQKK